MHLEPRYNLFTERLLENQRLFRRMEEIGKERLAYSPCTYPLLISEIIYKLEDL